MTKDRTFRNYGTADVVVAFARYGVALGTISRAIVINTDQARTICERAIASGELQMMPPELPTDTRSATLTELVHMRSSLDEARALVRELQDAQRETVGEFVGVAKMTGKESAVAGMLANHGRVTKARLYDALYGMRHEDEQPQPKIVDVFICKLRKKLKPHGIEVGTVWGVGYSMTPEHAAQLRALPYSNARQQRAFFASRTEGAVTSPTVSA